MKKLNPNYTAMSRQSGLTLIELMAATIILAILASAAVPAMQGLFERKSVFAIGDLFVKSIKLARLEAIQRGKTVQVRPIADSSDWSQGWVIEEGSETIRTFPQLPSSPVFTSDDYDGSPNLVILPTGQVNTVGAFDLYYANCVGDQRLSFNLLLSGLVQRGVSSCSTI